MNPVNKTWAVIALVCGFFVLMYALTHTSVISVLQPEGLIAHKEYGLMLTATALMLIIVLPVFALAAIVAYHYRATNTNAKYTPNWEHNVVEEFIWWSVPCVIIGILAMIIWTSSHELDPFRPLTSTLRPITVQVVALNWKWLFIYPEYGIATLNYLEIPEHTPITFHITADAPMNSFWIPQLAGQMYAMPGMTTLLHIITDGTGSYRGSSANFSGPGFSGMTFEVSAVSRPEFDQWVSSVQNGTSTLDTKRYSKLVEPSSHNLTASFAPVDTNLFNTIVQKYMTPQTRALDHSTAPMRM